MVRVFNKPGQPKLYGSIDYLINFMPVNKLLLSSYKDIQTIYPDQSLGAFFFKNSVQIMGYEESQQRQKDFRSSYFACEDSMTEGKSSMFRFFIYNDKNYHLEQDWDSDTLITNFPGLLRYTNHFYHENKIKIVKFGDDFKIPQVDYNNEEISIKEIDEKIGWNLFCDALNLKLDFYYLKTKSTLELSFISICKDLIAVRIEYTPLMIILLILILNLSI
ncbi:hypothetical protein K502DRAFT_351974 [Neoconidiobolus thromboides FSU 785]|nr:hypothetical protein K502DRAFT_351974 [Neoconidiobolus thromboides FSU 785]